MHPVKVGVRTEASAAWNRRMRGGFTLLELLVVITIIALLAGLGVKTYGYAQVSAAKKKTRAQMEALKLGLEKYKGEFGEYPRAVNPRSADTATEWLGGYSFKLGGAQVLYQALSGDGTDKLDLGGSGSALASDGEIDDDEAENMVMNEVDPQANSSQMVKESEGVFLLIDGFGNPWQYRHGDETGAINSTYDLWSFGDAEDFGGDETDVHWIRNW